MPRLAWAPRRAAKGFSLPQDGFIVITGGPGSGKSTLLSALDRRGFAVGSGSACTSSTLEPSHVLAAMGVLTQGNVRLALPATTTAPDVEAFLDVLPGVVREVRAALDPEA